MQAVGPKKVAFADEVQQKSAEASTASTTTPSNVGTRITLPRISDMVNTSIKAKQNGAISSPKPLINSKEDLEHDRSLDEKRVEKLLTAFDTDEEIAERALEKAKQEEISKLAAQKTVSQETSKTLEASAKPSFSFGKIFPFFPMIMKVRKHVEENKSIRFSTIAISKCQSSLLKYEKIKSSKLKMFLAWNLGKVHKFSTIFNQNYEFI